jgi:acyl-CoA thioesterase FadM
MNHFVNLPPELRDAAIIKKINLSFYRFVFFGEELTGELQIKHLKNNTITTKIELTEEGEGLLNDMKTMYKLTKKDTFLHALFHIKKNPHIYLY